MLSNGESLGVGGEHVRVQTLAVLRGSLPDITPWTQCPISTSDCRLDHGLGRGPAERAGHSSTHMGGQSGETVPVRCRE